MEIDELLWAYFTSLARYIPSFLVYLVGLILALVWMRKHTKVSVFLIISIVILFLNSVITAGVFIWLPNYLRTQGSSASEIGVYFTIIGVVSNLIFAGAFILVLLAVFSGRSANSSH